MANSFPDRSNFALARWDRLRRADQTRIVEEKQLDEGIGDTFVSGVDAPSEI